MDRFDRVEKRVIFIYAAGWIAAPLVLVLSLYGNVSIPWLVLTVPVVLVAAARWFCR